MPNRAHEQTNALLTRLERKLNTIYDNAARKIRKISLDEIYLDNPDATQKQRLDYANKNGKTGIIRKTVDIITQTNEQAVILINQQQMENYKLNFVAGCDEIIRQIQDSMDKGGE